MGSQKLPYSVYTILYPSLLCKQSKAIEPQDLGCRSSGGCGQEGPVHKTWYTLGLQEVRLTKSCGKPREEVHSALMSSRANCKGRPQNPGCASSMLQFWAKTSTLFSLICSLKKSNITGLVSALYLYFETY